MSLDFEELLAKGEFYEDVVKSWVQSLGLGYTVEKYACYDQHNKKIAQKYYLKSGKRISHPDLTVSVLLENKKEVQFYIEVKNLNSEYNPNSRHFQEVDKIDYRKTYLVMEAIDFNDYFSLFCDTGKDTKIVFVVETPQSQWYSANITDMNLSLIRGNNLFGGGGCYYLWWVKSFRKISGHPMDKYERKLEYERL